MSWAEVSPTLHQRKLGGLETIYRFASQSFKHIGQEQWLLRTSCKVVLPPQTDVVAPLRLAWEQLIHEHPFLRAIVSDFQATVDLDKSVAEDSFFVHHEPDVQDAVNQRQLRDLPSLLYFTKRSEILLLSSHWRMDATGCCILLDRLLDLLSRNVEGSATEYPSTMGRLVPSLEDAAQAPLEPTPDIEKTASTVTLGFRQAAMKTLGLKYRGDRTMPPTSTACTSVRLSRESTQRLVAQCKARSGMSVSAAVFAALSFTMFEQQETDSNEYTTIMAVNMRTHLPEPYDSKDYACAAYVTSITPTVKRTNGFLNSAESLTQEFKNWHSKEYDLALREIYAQASGALLNRPMLPPGMLPPPPPSGITLSSLGIIENLVRREHIGSNGGVVQVRDFNFQVNMFTRQMLMYLWTFDGQMCLSVNYNSAYYDAKVPHGLLLGMVDILKKELGVELEVSE